MQKVCGIRCKKCNKIIYSRTTHDFRMCPCHSCAVDGGRDYLSITGAKDDWELVKDIEAPDQMVLVKDWNTGADKYGMEDAK